MIRKLHRWPGLLALALVTLLALSGAALSIFPSLEHLSAPQTVSDQSVADLATRIQSALPGVEQIKRAPSGQITAYWFKDGTPGAGIIDPLTGQAVASADPNPMLRWLTNLHRSLFLGDGGRIAMAVGALAMLVLAISGTLLVVRRMGGWRRWFAPLRGPWAGRIHVELARVAVLGLALSSVTALWMTASTFDLLPDGEAIPAFPTETSGETGATFAAMERLASTPVSELRELSFPYPDDASDVFTLTTDQGMGFIDQGTGKMLAWADLSPMQSLSETIYMLHTGQGAALLGLALGLMALAIPAMGFTGVLIWLSGRRGRPRLHHNAPASRAETILLVGSEGGSTWGFATTLHKALTEAGQTVHATALSAFDPSRYGKAKRILILAATYGDGDAPSTAKGFLDQLAKSEVLLNVPLAVLGLGDRSFPAYCAYAQAVSQAARAKGWSELLAFHTVDRQSAQEFARWGRALGTAMGIPLELAHHPVQPATQVLTLIDRRDYGAEVQAPTAILRFALPKTSLMQRLMRRSFGRFQAGDLIGILPEGSAVPRLYSLASGTHDGFVEIVVKKHPGGLCSGQLIELKVGETVTGFLRRNTVFHPDKGRAPLILIGAGTGIGPLAGIIRGNTRKRPVHLFFGMRHPDSDFLYGSDMRDWQNAGQMTHLTTAVSRTARPQYVQDALRSEQSDVIRLIRDGARVMVCGGRDMAQGVSEALTDILAPVGLTPFMLKSEGRYVEDVY